MEREIFDKAIEIKKELDEIIKLNSYLYNSSLYISLGKLDTANEWVSTRLPAYMKDNVIDFLKHLTEKKIQELEQQFNEL